MTLRWYGVWTCAQDAVMFRLGLLHLEWRKYYLFSPLAAHFLFTLFFITVTTTSTRAKLDLCTQSFYLSFFDANLSKSLRLLHHAWISSLQHSPHISYSFQALLPVNPTLALFTTYTPDTSATAQQGVVISCLDQRRPLRTIFVRNSARPAAMALDLPSMHTHVHPWYHTALSR